jgi:hypothetical protein
MKILAVTLLDPSVSTSDQFFVQTGEDEVMLYEAFADGRVIAVINEPAPLRYVTASIEKFNNGYRVETPVAIASIDELPKFLRRFEITSETSCRLVKP